MINCVIIDDEEGNRSALQTLISKHCPEIHVSGQAENADDGYKKILDLKPQLIFLDVKMPGKSGFDLLKRFSIIDFEVIFISAFDKYAIRAFDFNAVAYILKPVSVVKLISAVSNARERIDLKSGTELVMHFIKTLSDKDELLNKFSLHHNGKVIFVNISDIAFIQTLENNTILNLSDNSHYYSSKDLAKFEDVLQNTENFIRVSKAVIINTNYIKSYSKGEVCLIEMKCGQVFEVSRRRKTEILKRLKTA